MDDEKERDGGLSRTEFLRAFNFHHSMNLEFLHNLE